MSKKIELVHAEIITQYQSTSVLKEFTTDKGGTVFNWQVKTRVNDKIEKSPYIYDNCSAFAENDEQKKRIREMVTNGAIVDIKGFADRRKGNKLNAEGKAVYFDSINVKEITPITNINSATPISNEDADEDLPF